MSRPRRTKRKVLIEEIWDTDFHGQPMLLDELRWCVFRKETGQAEMTRSARESLRITICHYLPGIKIVRLTDPYKQIPCGVVGKVALYRSEHYNSINSFLDMDTKHIRFALRGREGRPKPRRTGSSGGWRQQPGFHSYPSATSYPSGARFPASFFWGSRPTYSLIASWRDSTHALRCSVARILPLNKPLLVVTKASDEAQEVPNNMLLAKKLAPLDWTFSFVRGKEKCWELDGSDPIYPQLD